MFEIAANAPVEMHAAAVEHERCRRHKIGAKPDRTDEPIFNKDQRDARGLSGLGEAGGNARGPDRNGARSRAASFGEGGSRRTAKGWDSVARPEKVADLPPLPERHPETNGYAAVGRFLFSPLADDVEKVL